MYEQIRAEVTRILGDGEEHPTQELVLACHAHIPPENANRRYLADRHIRHEVNGNRSLEQQIIIGRYIIVSDALRLLVHKHIIHKSGRGQNATYRRINVNG